MMTKIVTRKIAVGVKVRMGLNSKDCQVTRLWETVIPYHISISIEY